MSAEHVVAIDLADTASTAARDHPDVVDLDAGLAGEFATYGVDARVRGVRVDRRSDGHDEVRLRLVVRYGRPVQDIGREVRSDVTDAIAHAGQGRATVHAHIVDIVEVDEAEAAAPGDSTSGSSVKS